MSGTYGLDDVDQIWSVGKSISELDTDASSYSNGLVDALGGVHAGGDSPGILVNSAIKDFQIDVSDAGNHLAHEIRNLGEGVVAGAKEAADTDKEGTTVAAVMLASWGTNNVTNLFRSPSGD